MKAQVPTGNIFRKRYKKKSINKKIHRLIFQYLGDFITDQHLPNIYQISVNLLKDCHRILD